MKNILHLKATRIVVLLLITCLFTLNFSYSAAVGNGNGGVGNTSNCTTCATIGLPSQTGASVDGNAGEWNTSETGSDFWSNLYNAGRSDPSTFNGYALTAKSYLRYTYNPSDGKSTVYVYVMSANTATFPIWVDPATAWSAIGFWSNKVYTGSSPSFQWVGVGYDGNPQHALGYEASFTLTGSTSVLSCVIVHCDVDNLVAGVLQTAATGTFSGEPGKCLTVPPYDPPQNCSINCPGDVSANNDAGQCYATNVNLGSPSVDGGCTISSMSNDAPAEFAVGTTTVHWSVTLSNGQTSSCSQTVTVVDVENPSISVSDVSANTDGGQCSASNVNLGTPTTSDNCGVESVTNDAPETYPVGTTTVTWTVTDIHGNSSTATQTVTVTDNEQPSIGGLSDVTVNNDAGQCSASNINLGTPTTSDNCGVQSVSNDCPETIPVGVTTTVTWTVTDIHGNTNTTTQTVTVVDNEKPSISGLNEVSVNTDAGQCSASNVDLGTPNTSDNCGVESVTNDAPATYPYGTTTVTWTVTDIHGNSTTTTQTVTVNDNERPTIGGLSDVTVNNDAGQCSSSNVNLGTPTTSDNCGVQSVSNDGSGTYSVGTTAVTWTVTDIHGNSSTYTQYVTVNDVENPTISGLSAVTVNSDAGQCSASNVNLGTPTTSDNCGVQSVTNNAPSSFPVGTTTVTWTVTDIHGNSTTTTQTVTVLGKISGKAFYDANGNGSDDDGKVLAGWTVKITYASTTITLTTNGNGMYCANLPIGTYTVSEVIPTETWTNTTPAIASVSITSQACNPVVNFGANCSASISNGHTLGFWSNSNGQAVLSSKDPAWRSLANGLNMRNANGTLYTVATSGTFTTVYSGFRSWLLGASATNMAYMLSAQLAANTFSTSYWGLNASSVVIIPGSTTASGGANIVSTLASNATAGFVRNATNGNGYITIGALQAAGKASLAANGNTTASGAVRTYQDCIKTLLDKLNNNAISVVSGTICPISGNTKSNANNSEIQSNIPTEFAMKQNYPNPFNPVTSIQFDLPVNSFVTLKVYDILGQEVATLLNQEVSAGVQTVQFDAANIPSGIYIYKINAGDYTETKKMILMK